jgi:hypothetical protein
MKKIECFTLFDITATGVNNSRSPESFPWMTRGGILVKDNKDLVQARNQQRNWDTLLQLIGMRTQSFEIETPKLLEATDHTSLPVPVSDQRVWYFAFSVENPQQWLLDDDYYHWLKNDSDCVPMIVGLTETPGLDPYIIVQGSQTNLWFRDAVDK